MPRQAAAQRRTWTSPGVKKLEFNQAENGFKIQTDFIMNQGDRS